MKDVIITILICVVIVLFFHTDQTRQEPIVQVHTDTIYQNKVFTKIKEGKDIPYKVIDTLQIHDTLRIIQEYSQVKEFKDTIYQDSCRFVIIDTIGKNTLLGRKFEANLTFKTYETIKTIWMPEQKSLYLGIIGDLRTFDNKLGIGVGLNYKVPKKGLFSVNWTTNQISVGYYKKLF